MLKQNDKAMCSPDYYADVGFNIILTWLKENCLCILNRDYFSDLTPLNNIKNIEETQSLSDELLASFQRSSPIPLSTIPDISELFTIIEVSGSQLNADQFHGLYQILICSSLIRKTLKKNDFPLWHSNSRNLLDSSAAISSIEKIFDDAFQLKPDASINLKRLSKAISSMEGKINQTMTKIFNHAREENWLNGEKIVWRNGRSMLPLKVSRKRKIKGIVQDQSATGQTAYIEPLEIIELNNQLTDLQFELEKEKQLILRQLTEYFQPMASQIQESFYVLQHLDRYFALAKLAHKLNGIRPALNEDGHFILNKATNPIFMLTDKKVVPLDLHMKTDQILLLSGPNAGGKTFTLKSLGLLILMAQCGMHIPATKVELPIFNQFFADIGDQQSIEDDLSTFSAHIQNLSEIVKKSDQSTLVLLDELGTGTDPDAGAALSRAILEVLLKKKAIVITTTHLGALKVWAFDTKGVVNGGMIFDSKALAPTYELQLGTPGASYALEISKRMGLDDKIIKHSQTLLKDGSGQLENIISELEKERLKSALLNDELQMREKKLKTIEKEIHDKQTEVDKAHRKAKSSAASEAENIILTARREAENVIAEIRESQASKESIHKAKEKIENTLNKLHIEKIPETKKNVGISKTEATVDASVFIPHLNTEGKIIHLPDKHDMVRVQANGVTLKLKLSELSLTHQLQEDSKPKKQSGSNQVERLQDIQIDLRGKRVEEALEDIEKFLDGAILSGLELVNILHGKGTGALMEAIHEYLKNQSFIKDYKFANEEQGGAGITVVKFK